ncbi:MAG: DUF294 nucleotidyltransferase-like domain-containing protein [Myxococcota bacterium]
MDKTHPNTTPGDVEVADLCDYLRQVEPFDRLGDGWLRATAQRLTISYVPAGQLLMAYGEPNTRLGLVRKGAVELCGPDGQLEGRLGERQLWGYPSLLTSSPSARDVRTLEDCLVYQWDEAWFHRLREECANFASWFDRAHKMHLGRTMREHAGSQPLTVLVNHMLTRAPVVGTPDMTVRQAASVMSAKRVSSLLVTEEGKLVGIVTDRDLRSRVLAHGLSSDTAVSEVMTPRPYVVKAETFAFEALLQMSRHNIHHLPVVEGGNVPVGMITTTDVMRLQASSPVYVVSDVWKQTDEAGLVLVAKRLPGLIGQMVAADAKADEIGRLTTIVADALTQRLVQLAEEELGKAPVPFAWVALGSQARQELNAHSDQDNALVIGDGYRPEEHEAWFAALAKRVCDGLMRCGFPYCPGDVMASNPIWRMPMAQWSDRFGTWIAKPSPKAILHSTVFFDMRPVAGDGEMAVKLMDDVYRRGSANTVFVAMMADDAIEQRPPLGFFRQFVLERHGSEEKVLDIKKRGLMPVVDLARTHALAAGLGGHVVSTQRRLEALEAAKVLTPSDAADVRDAFEFMGYVRLRHQANQLQAGRPADNYVSPETLSPFERRHLKEAFRIVETLQSGLVRRYRGGVWS